MEIIKKISKKNSDLFGAKPVNIVFLGDSVTHGCFECYFDRQDTIQTVFDSKNSFSARFGEVLKILYPSAQINIINSGISGDIATNALNRLERDVLSYKPDLVVVSFGLNDVCSLANWQEPYKKALTEIFKRIKECDSEIIFLTQNFMNTEVSCFLDSKFENLAQTFAQRQLSGQLEECFEMAKNICKEQGVVICDLYGVWEKLFDNGVNTTELLSNKLNHPIREYHYYVAIKLVETIFNI